MDLLERVTNLALYNGGAVFYREESKDRYLTYMVLDKNGKKWFGYVEANGKFSSEYKPSKIHGTGAEYACIFNPTYETLLNAAKTVIRAEDGEVFWYNDEKDYLRERGVFLLDTIMKDSDGEKYALEVLNGDYLFSSDRHIEVVDNDIHYLESNYFNKRFDDDEHLAIFEINNNSLRTVVSKGSVDFLKEKISKKTKGRFK